MTQLTIQLDPIGDTPKQVEDKVRALPANQGLNEDVMRRLIDDEVNAVRNAKKLRDTESYHGPETGDVHGKS